MKAQTGRMRIGLIAAGRVGTAMASALRAVGHTIIGAYAPSPEAVDRLDAMLPGVPAREILDIVAQADLVLLAIDDAEIAPTVAGLAQMGAWRAGQILVHTSPLFGVNVLEPAAQCGVMTLALHPAMRFSGTSLDVARLSGCFFAVTASPAIQPIGLALAAEMGAEAVIIPEQSRPAYGRALGRMCDEIEVCVGQAVRQLAECDVLDPAALAYALAHDALETALRTGPYAMGQDLSRWTSDSPVTSDCDSADLSDDE
ncbi:Rossmann-like and DUF2520 domain-containing protein [Trueperella sp. LYQ143]|uniref:Rossmann-like and DUF2520 domain-containing protein n=1 Tax=Trueperella sp. LYQ143 TaxID=3391059 RepID=UPI0039834E23